MDLLDFVVQWFKYFSFVAIIPVQRKKNNWIGIYGKIQQPQFWFKTSR